MRHDGFAFETPDIREGEHAPSPRRGSIYAGKMQNPNDGCIYWLALSEAGPVKIGFSHRQLVDAVASDLGAKDEARRKWRGRGIPADWKIKIAQEMESRGQRFSAGDFDAFDTLESAAS